MFNSRPTAVYASTDGHDDLECLFQPEETKCSSLSYILTTIIEKNMTWIETIWVNNYTMTTHTDTATIMKVPTMPRTITISCSTPCIVQTEFSLSAESFHRNLVLVFKAISFKNSQIGLGNVLGVFRDVQFLSSLVTDTKPNEPFAHLELHFIDSAFRNPSVAFNSVNLKLQATFSLTLVLQSSDLTNISVQVQVSHLMLVSMGTFFSESNLTLDCEMFCHATFKNSNFSGITPNSSHSSLVDIISHRLDLEFTECVVEGWRGLTLTKPEFGLIGSWIQVTIQNCTLHKNKKQGPGGAIAINFFAPKANLQESPDNFVNIFDSQFVKNSAERFGSQVVQGGGLSVQSHTSGDSCKVLQLVITRCTFTNNKATDGGGAIFVSDSCTKTFIKNTTSVVNTNTFDSTSAVFILSMSDFSIDGSVSRRPLRDGSPSLLELEMSAGAHVSQFNVVVQCHAWQNVTLETKLIEQKVMDVKIACTSCQPSFYIPTDTEYIISYQPNQTGLHTQSTGAKSEEVGCIPCPAGAFCSGNELKARPNFWGVRADDGIAMYQCPAEYCCTTDCTGFKQCSGHRTGVLCGSCEEHYSLSMLSSECLDETSCSDYWLWLIVVLAVIVYLSWYIFKNDIFAIPAFVAKKVCKRCSTITGGSDVYYIDKGYFGIVTYFIQVKSAMNLSISLDISRPINTIFSQVESYIDMALNFELTFLTYDACALSGLTTTSKTMFRLLFLVGIYVSWNFALLCLFLSQWLIGTEHRFTDKLKNFKFKLIYGLVEVIKYTYLGLTSVVFYSLTCTTVAGKEVWFYDGSVQCYSEWQIAMISFCLMFTLPYPFLIHIGMKLLRSKKISRTSFFLATCCPLPVLLYWIALSITRMMITSFNRPMNDQGGADSSGHGSSAPHGCHGADASKGTPRPDAAPPERIWACGHGLTGGGTLSSHHSAGSCARTDAINCASHTSENQSGAWGPLPGAADFEAQSGRGCGVVQLPMPIV